VAEPLTPRQRQTLAARQTFAQTFTTPEKKREYYSALGRKAAEGRVVLSASDASVIAEAHRSLEGLTRIVAKIAERVEKESTASPTESGEAM
jgi:hypothetical protein